MRFVAFLVLLSQALPVGAATENGAVGNLTLDQVLTRMRETNSINSAALARYTCLRRYTLKNHRFHKAAELTVLMTYSAPGHKTFEVLNEQGSSIIRQRVLRRMFEAEEEASRDDLRPHTQITPENYNFRLVGTEMRHGRGSYVLDVAPKSNNKFLIRGRVWVDSQDFAIVHLEGAPAQNPSAVIRNTAVVHQYAKYAPFWLPLSNRSHSDSFLFGRTDVAIDYWNYEITEAKAGTSPVTVTTGQ